MKAPATELGISARAIGCTEQHLQHFWIVQAHFQHLHPPELGAQPEGARARHFQNSVAWRFNGWAGENEAICGGISLTRSARFSCNPLRVTAVLVLDI